MSKCPPRKTPQQPATAKEKAISAAAVSQLILLRDAIVSKAPEQLVETTAPRGPMTEEELLCLWVAQAHVAAAFGMEAPPPISFNPGELYARHWKEVCERLDLGVDPTCTRPSPSLLRSLCLAVVKSPFQQPLAQSLLVVFAEALLRHLLFSQSGIGELQKNFRPDMKEIIGGLAQALVEHHKILPSQAHKKTQELLGNRISEGAIRKHHERYKESYNYPTLNSNGQNRSFGTPVATKAPLWFWYVG